MDKFIIRSEDLKDVCSKILTAVDSTELSLVTETLELIANGDTLTVGVTNREYFAEVKLKLEDINDFHATVNATLFLKLISQITTDTIELSVVENTLVVKGNGTYKLPLIFDGEELLKLPKIEIENVTAEFPISADTLNSILQYNSKELTKGTISKPVQKLYYVDELGAITFTNGACVNSFSLAQPIRVLFNNRLVKLFKLFKVGLN
jgi:DNA polymerase III sliding clamp (beta) subunit (PCNA family)